MPRGAAEVADVFRHYGEAYRQQHGASLSTAQRRVMTAIEQCRTAALGGRVEQCDAAAIKRICYNSCRNRHCPKCQSLARAEWLEDRRSELLTTPYFHVVFTVPQQIAAIAHCNKGPVYNILFHAAAETLQTIAADPKHLGAELGFFAVLHTWAQTLLHHPHLHCVVAGGGLSADGSRWIACRPNFFLPVRVPARLFRRLFPASLEKAFDANKLAFCGHLQPLGDRRIFLRHLAPARKADWCVYAKPPFTGPEQVLADVARYTHRVAISNNRLLDIDEDNVRFHWKDYRNGNRQKTMMLAADEFIRRFSATRSARGLSTHPLLWRMWRKLGEQEEIAELGPGVSLTIPTGTHFQFRCDVHEPLNATGATMPPWPGENEAFFVDGAWQPTV
jgi:Putative transposase/Transposase zinc-binding domain